jgi:hypothetical protein
VKENQYMLEIYLPGSAEDVIATFESHQPFIVIAEGDLINPRLFDAGYDQVAGKLLRVVRLEHMIWKGEDSLKHKVCVMTEAIEDDHESRFR